ncbi:MAG: ABC transporter permease [Acidobacteria bacterium]|nr:ABC transporter permease [Acidobacteriota bacterium]MCA1632480.1 ABC transporter permease [Acidobacteriota bacterium]MCA1640833.1 ABC transporter permease [Acidobacteriota bacterium]
MSREASDIRAAERRVVWRSFGQSRTAVFGLVVLSLFLLAAVFADLIAPRDPQKTTGQTLRAPCAENPFGTDDLGRDVFSGVVHGARVSILIGVGVAISSGLIGVIVGATAGYAGGRTDDLLMRLTELFLIPPRFFLALVAAALFGSTFYTLIAVLAVTYWGTTARLVRAEVMSVKGKMFVEAARAVGATHARILLREIMPSALPVVITHVMLTVGAVILVEAGLGFIGLGDSSRISWGYMLHNGEHFMRDAWWMIFFPAAAISLLVLALNAVGDALNRALDPRARIEHLDKPA